MSPRAACRLETLGFPEVHDYVAGKADWLAHGRPTEGAQAAVPRAHNLLRTDVVTPAWTSASARSLRGWRARRTARRSQRAGGGPRAHTGVWGRPNAENREASWKPVMARIPPSSTTSTMTP
jgi:hypothetical protein